MTASSLWHIDSEKSALRSLNLPAPDENRIIVDSVCSMISTGTEKLVAKGLVPLALQEKMGVPYMDGTFALPIKYGYSLIGKIKNNEKEILVHLMHPHQDKCCVDKSHVFPLPESLSPQKAMLISNMETVINAIWDAGVSIGDKVLIVGFGNIGCLLAETIRHIPGIQLYIAEKNEWRKEAATSFGYELLEGEESGFSHTFDTSGTSAGLQTCIDVLRTEGKAISLGWYGVSETKLHLGSSFHYDRKKIISSQVSRIPIDKSGHWNYTNRKELAIRLLLQYEYEKYITRMIPFKDSPNFFKQLRNETNQPGLIWGIKY